jgi:hypothetical protein
MNILRPNITSYDTIRQLTQALEAGYYPFVPGGTTGLGAHLEWLFNFSDNSDSTLTSLMQEILSHSRVVEITKQIHWINAWDYCMPLSVARWAGQAGHQLVFYEPYPTPTPAVMNMTISGTSHILDPAHLLRFVDELQMLEARPDDVPGEFYVVAS